MDSIKVYSIILLAVILFTIYIYYHTLDKPQSPLLTRKPVEHFSKSNLKLSSLSKIPNNNPIQTNVIPKREVKFQIPKKLHQTVKSKDNLDRALTRNMDSWKNKNPDFQYYLYDDKDCELFLAKYFSPKHVQTFYAIKAGAGKADFFRYCVLYQEGGVYSDIDMRCLENLFTWIQPGDTFVIPKDCDNECVDLFQAFIASTPGNPILKLAIDKVVFHVEKRIFCKDILKLSGPNMIGKCVNRYLNRKRLHAFQEGEIHHKNQQIRIITHNIKNPREYITCGGKRVIKSQTWFRRRKTQMPPWGRTKLYC